MIKAQRAWLAVGAIGVFLTMFLTVMMLFGWRGVSHDSDGVPPRPTPSVIWRTP
jgi:hypothetical protein